VADIIDPFDPPAGAKPTQTAAPDQSTNRAIVDPFDPAVAAARANHSTLGDLGRSALGALARGTGEVLQGINDVGVRVNNAVPVAGALQHFAEQHLGAATPAQAFAKDQALQDWGAREQTNVSPQFAAKTAMGLTDKGGFNLTNIANKSINTVAGMVPALAGTALASLGGPETGIPAGIALFGAQGEAGGRNAGEQQVADLTDAQLGQVPAVKQYLAQGMTLPQARAALSAHAANVGGLTSGLFGAALGAAGEIPGVGALGRTISDRLAPTVGTRVAQTIGHGIGEGTGFAGLNATGQVASNLANPVPTNPTSGVLESAASGFLPGALLGGFRGAVAKAGPLGRAADTARQTGAAMPEADAAALRDNVANASQDNPTAAVAGAAADTIAEPQLQSVAPAQRGKVASQYISTLLRLANAADTTPEARQQALDTAYDWTRRAAAGEFGETALKDTPDRVTAARQWPLPNWVDRNTGEMRVPTDDELAAQAHVLADAGNNLSDKFLSRVWAVDPQRVQAAKAQVRADRKAGLTTQDAFDRAAQSQPTGDLLQGVDNQGDTGTAPAVGVPFMITNAMRQDLAARGYDDAAIARMRPEDAHAILAQPVTPPASETADASAAAEPAAPAPSEAPNEPAQTPEPVAPVAGQAPPAPSVEGSAPVDRAAAAIPESSGAAPVVGIGGENTPNVGETQPVLPQREASAQAAGAAASARVDENAAPPVQPTRVVKASVPLGAGMSADGKTMYVDHRIPDVLDVPREDGTIAKVRLYSTDNPAEGGLPVHEGNEFPQMLQGKKYQDAHNENANSAEDAYYQQKYGVTRAAVDKALKPYLDAAHEQGANATDIPADLDRKPYVDSGEAGLLAPKDEGASVDAILSKNAPRNAYPEPDANGLITTKTLNGKTVRVHQSDLAGDRQRIPTYSAGGDRVPNAAVHRLNLDPTGEKRAALAEQTAKNPLFDVVTRKDGSAFANRPAAQRELNRQGLQATHSVVAADTLKPGARGYVVLNKTRLATEATHEHVAVAPERRVGEPASGEPVHGRANTGVQAAAVAPQHGTGTEAARNVSPGDVSVPASERGAKVTEPVATGDVTQAPARNTKDAGEELWANRRNSTGHGLNWNDVADLNTTLKAREVVKSKAWPRPDYEKLVEDGVSPVLARVIKQVYDAAAANPQTRGAPTDAQYQAYLGGLAKLRDALFGWARRMQDTPDVERLLAKGADGVALSKALRGESESGTPLLDALFPATGSHSRFRGNDEQSHSNNALANLLGGNKLVRALQVTNHDIEQARKDVDAGWPAPQEAWQKSYSVHESRPGESVYENGQTRTVTEPEFWVAKKDGRFRRIVATGFKTREAAEAAAKEAYTQSRKTGGDNAPKEPRVMLAGAREGVARRPAGENVTSDKLKDTFGFRGINFGNWLKTDDPRTAAERQAHLNHAYDSLMDLAEILNVPPKALSLDGKLGVAFGAQGHGGRANAHFVPGVNEINLTRERGAGSLAHEWAHALDHYFATLAGEKLATSRAPFLTEHLTGSALEGLRPEIRDAFKTIVNAMNKRPETRQEAENRIVKVSGRYRSALDRDLTMQRESMANAMKDGEDRAARLAEFDELAARLRRGDLGEGYVTTGRGAADKHAQTVGLLANLYKDATGRRMVGVEVIGTEARGLSRLLDDKAENKLHATTDVDSEYAKQAKLLEGARKGSYWSTNLEKFARAFQSYVIDKLAAKDAHNHYLSRPQMSPEMIRALGEKLGTPVGDLYPRGVERERIDKAFDTLIGVVKHEETPEGNVRLFSKPDTEQPARRTLGLPESVKYPLARFRNDQPLKRDPDYRAAKAGDSAAAVRLVKRLAGPLVQEARTRFGTDTIFVAPHAEEATGKNAIPQQLASALAAGTNGVRDDEIVQTNRAHHTGADIMQRLIARPEFDGTVVKGGRYVLVDDVSTSGGTFADLADYIQRNGGDVVGAVSLTNAARGGKLAAESNIQRRLEARHGDVIREQLGIEPSALTAEEAGYLTGFRSADEIRNRVAAARQERSRRLRAKGIQGLASRPTVTENAPHTAGRTVSGRVARDRLDRVVGSATRQWGKDQPQVEVVASPEGLPTDAKRDPGYARAEGYYDGSRIWLVASNIASEVRARQVLAHEAVGHYGVDRIVTDAYGNDAWNKIITSIARLDREGLGGDEMQALLRDVHRRYPTADAETFAKEAIAVMAERGVRNTFTERVLTAIRRYLHKIMPNLNLSPAELRQLLVRSDRMLRKGSEQARREQARMVAAHAFDKTPDTFYSALTEAVNKAKGAPRSADAAVWKQWLDGAQRRGEFKGAEREWMGVDQWLDEHKGTITRGELNDFVRQNQVHVQEVVHGDEPPINAAGIRENEDGTFDLVDEGGALATAPERPTKFGEYTLPGGKNYRELLLTLPEQKATDGGFGDWQQHARKMGFAESEIERVWKSPDREADPEFQAWRHGQNGNVSAAQFRSGHFEEPNILAHVRFNDRTGPDGEKILHVEEVQSDWHQAGRRQGYVTREQRAEADAAAAKLAAAKRSQADAVHAYRMAYETGHQGEIERANEAMMKAARASADAASRLSDLERNHGAVPDAPLKKTEQWSMLAMKRVLRYAADHGYDKVTWTTGEQQAARYDLSKSIDKLIYMPDAQGGLLFAYGKDGNQVLREPNVTPDKLADYVGKEAAQKLVDQTPTAGATGQAVKELRGADLKLGGEGMKAFYDKMLPNELNKYVKQWGAKVGESRIGTAREHEMATALREHGYDPATVTDQQILTDNGGRRPGWLTDDDLEAIRDGSISEVEPMRETVHSVDITPAMRDSVQQGQPLFARREATRDAYDTEGRASQTRLAGLPTTETDPRNSSAERSGLRLPRDVRQLRGYKQRVLTEQDLVKYRQEHPFDGDAGTAHPQGAPTRGAFSVRPATPEDPADPAREPARALDAQANVLREKDANAFQRAKDWVAGKTEDVRPAVLGWLQTNHVIELMRDKIPFKGTVDRYERSSEQLDADRQILLAGSPDAAEHPTDMLKKGAVPISDDLQRFAYGHGTKGLMQAFRGRFTPEAKRTFDVMHGATIAGVDPAVEYERLTIRNARGERVAWTMENRAERKKLLKDLAMERGGDAPADREKLTDELKYLNALPRLEKQREADYARLKQQFDALPEEGKRMYRETRDWYARYSEETEKALIKNIEALDVPETYRRSLVQRMRFQFEDARVQGVYFPLNRNGDFWIAYRTPEGKNGFEMFETFAKAKKREAQLKGGGNSIDATGRRDKNAKAKDAPSGTFVREVIDALAKAKVSEKVQDQVYQAYLQMLPDLSMRKHAIHRGNVIGYDPNVPRTFAKMSFHGAYQLAKLRHSQDMQFALDAMGVSMDNWRKRDDKFPGANPHELEQFMEGALARYEANPDAETTAAANAKLDDSNRFNGFTRSLDELAERVAGTRKGPTSKVEREAWESLAKRWRALPAGVRRAYTLDAAERFGLHGPKSSAEIAKMDDLLSELKKRHDWIMNPSDQQLANMVNSIGFIYYLGASPASALTNLTQIVQTTLPYLGARHGWGKASRMLSAAWWQAARTGGNMERLLTDAEEHRAYMEMQQRGIFSRTQSHTLAGIAEGNALQGNPAWARIMNGISWMFHQSELVNRQATGMAAFRIARADGKNFDDALEYARQVNNDTNFDYSSANRPRRMQGNVPRIALQFKNYSIGMTWLYWRNFQQAFKGETPEIRRVAARTVAGVTGMTALLAGATGLPVYNAVKMTANAANTLFGDDNQPWNFDDAFHRWLADNLGPNAARLIAEGPTNYLTGANLASRTSMSNMWIHDNDQGLEGADAYHALLENLAGPAGGIVQNYYVGSEDVRRGHLWRGVERMLPTAAKNAMKAVRYASEGVNSMRGDPIVPDVSSYEDFLQAIGFQPAKVADQYRINTAMKNFTGEVKDRRLNLMNAYALALKSGDEGVRQTAIQKIVAFNNAHPEVPISRAVLQRSLSQRAHLSAQASHGIVLSKRLQQGAAQYAGATQ
jgi:hypothetical protein